MPQRANSTNISTPRRSRGNVLTGGVVVFVAAVAGVAAGVVASLAVVMPMVRAEFAAQSKLLDTKSVAVTPVGDVQACVGTPSAAVVAPQVLGASVSLPSGGQGGGTVVPPSSSSGGSQTFVTNLVKGTLQKNAATIENTGPNSENKVIESNQSTTTVTNTNDIAVTNTNKQAAVSGSASVTENTTGGSATSGDASNANNTSLKINIANE